jgi:uncharacterized membrane protein YkoI
LGRRLTRTAATLLVLLAQPLLADDHQQARQLREAGEILPLQAILSGLPADERVLEVELELEGGRYLYEVEALDRRGTVWEYRYDARSGELLHRGYDN